MRHQLQEQAALFTGTMRARLARRVAAASAVALWPGCRPANAEPSPRARAAHRARSRALQLAAGFLACLAPLTLTGCAGGIGLQQDGTYALATRETGMDCQGLAKRIGEEVEVLKSLPDAARSEREQAAPTAVAAVGRLFASDGGLAAIAKYDRERAHVRALESQRADKGCPALDVEEQLAKSDAAIAELRRP